MFIVFMQGKQSFEDIPETLKNTTEEEIEREFELINARYLWYTVWIFPMLD